ncbi:MAG: hypothetical protein HC841_03750 [Verrucomicrobiae bacterium]|nr:hypothetical protein [Verrucomicrobiae bacterium]
MAASISMTGSTTGWITVPIPGCGVWATALGTKPAAIAGAAAATMNVRRDLFIATSCSTSLPTCYGHSGASDPLGMTQEDDP